VIRILIINFLLLFPGFYKKYQEGLFEFLRRFFMPFYEIEYKNLLLITESTQRTISLALDVGANVGQSSYAFRRIFPHAELHAFEPNPEIFQRLVKNLRNHQINLHNVGLGERKNIGHIYIPEYRNVLFTGLAACNRIQAEKHVQKLKLFRFHSSNFVTLQQNVFIETGDFFNLRPDLIKIDVEGFEIEVLQGLTRTIEAFKPLILVECSDTHDEVSELLSKWSYRNFEFSKKEKAWLPSKRSNPMQLFI
jgi:FkbM family methyltransferase